MPQTNVLPFYIAGSVYFRIDYGYNKHAWVDAHYQPVPDALKLALDINLAEYQKQYGKDRN